MLSLLLGKRLEDSKLSSEKFNTLWGIPVFASDAISSVSYAGEEILLVLVPVLGMASFKFFLPVVGAIIVYLVGIVLDKIKPAGVYAGKDTKIKAVASTEAEKQIAL